MEKITFVNENAPYVSAENLNQMQDNVENAINWKLYKSNVNASTTIDISTLVFNELYIEVRIGTTSAVSNNYITTFHILKSQLTTSTKYYRNGSYFTDGFNGGSVVEATRNSIKCVDNYFGGVVVDTHTRLDIYYK